MLAEMFGALEAPRARDFVNETEALPDGRVQHHVLTRAILFALSGNASYGQLIHAISAYPNLMPDVDFGVVTDETPGSPATNVYDVLALTSRIARIMGIEGYKDYDSTRHSIGPTTPEEGKAIPALGFRDLPVWINDGGRIERKEMDLTLDKTFGKLAYKDKLAQLILLRDTPNYKTAAWRLTSSIMKESMGLDPNGPDPVLYGTQLESIRGGAIRNWGELVDMCFPLTIAAQATLEVLNDGLELMRTAEGGHRQEHARKLAGAGYFDLYSMSELETAAATDLLDIYPGHFSKFAKRLLGKVIGSFENGFIGPYSGRREQAIKLLEDVMFYQSRMIDSDIIESSAILHELGSRVGENRATGERISSDIELKVSVLPQKHLRPFDTWSDFARTIDRGRLEDLFQIGADSNLWVNFEPILRRIGINEEEILGLSSNDLRGVDGFYHFIDILSDKGAEVFDWSKCFDARAFGNAIRYAEKVSNTIETLQQVGAKMAGLVGTLSERVTKHVNKAKQIEDYLTTIDGFGEEILGIIGQAKDKGVFFSFTEEGRMAPTMSHWLTGLERMFETPKLSDTSNYFVMYNRKQFVDSLGVNLNPDKINHDDLLKVSRERGVRSDWIENEIVKMGCRWSRKEYDFFDQANQDGQFLIGSSGRTLYKTYTVGEIYRMAGEDIRQILEKSELVGQSREEVEELYNYWKACGQFGRFSLQQLINRTSAGYANFIHWLDSFQNSGVISVRQQDSHMKAVKKLAKDGLIGITGFTPLGGFTEPGWFPVLPVNEYPLSPPFGTYPVFSRP